MQRNNVLSTAKYLFGKMLTLTSYIISICIFAESTYGSAATAPLSTPRILQLYLNVDNGGGGVVRREMQKLFQQNNVDATTLILDPYHAPTYKIFNQQQLNYTLTDKVASPDSTNFTASITQQIASLVKTNNFNIILCHDHADLNMLNNMEEKLPIKICFVVHTFHKIERTLRADAIIAVSPAMIPAITESLESAHIKLDIPVEHMYPIFNYKPYLEYHCRETDRSKFFKNTFNISIANDAFVITSIANFYMAHKNHAVLINAFEKIIKTYKQKAHLILAGIGPRKKEIETLVITHGLQENVHFVGFTDKIPDLLYNSDIKALTSDQEGCPISVMEASLMKKPIIGTAIPGIKALISDGKTGLLFEKNNHLDLADKIAYLIENPAYAQTLGENAYAHTVANCITPAIEKKILSFFQRLAETPKKPNNL
jgi:glycosyltransferase involved in cell wall biosynthesis